MTKITLIITFQRFAFTCTSYCNQTDDRWENTVSHFELMQAHKLSKHSRQYYDKACLYKRAAHTVPTLRCIKQNWKPNCNILSPKNGLQISNCIFRFNLWNFTSEYVPPSYEYEGKSNWVPTITITMN
jgi:hypothetical protein